jgi:predicted nuclease of predicted toxin-antitoxin system
MKILIDMNLSPQWLDWFRNAGIESAHWCNIGAATAKDQEIMAWALSNGYIVFTHDLDFGTLLASTQAGAPSVIQVRTQNPLPSAIGNIVVAELQKFRLELEAGALLTIDPARSRVRLLPINHSYLKRS